MSVPKDIIDDQKRPVSLLKLLGRGGEGAVYEILGDPTKAAKIYLPEKAIIRREKIHAMVQAQLQNGISNVAYPIKPLFRSNGLFAGFIMEKVGGRKPVHELYSPSNRRSEFAKADFRFLVRAALNVSNAVGAVHSSGCVIGDINHSGILVSQDATATLIDADSFQFRFGGALYRCTVGVPDFTPPELQGKRLDSLERTANHDSFGLGILVFSLLFMGRHPFVGDYRGTGALPIEQAVAECRFAYSSDRKRTGVEPPPHVPSLKDLPLNLANAFEIAFGPASTNAGRPTAVEWGRLLKESEAELVRCQNSPAHHFFKSAQNCPWCRMERGFPGFIAFTTPLPTIGSAPADLSQLIAAIRAVRDPGIAPPLVASMPSVSVTPIPSLATTDDRFGAFIVATLGAMITIPLLTTQTLNPILAVCSLAGCAFAALRAPAAPPPSQRKSDTLRKGFNLHEERYLAVADSRRFLDTKQKTESEIRELGGLGSEEARKIADLSRKLRELQLHHFLDRFQIASAKLKGIGNSKKATLRSYGIETAADISRSSIEAISGFGPATSSLLLSWRNSLEKRFIFNPAQPLNPADVAQVKAQVAQRRSRLEQGLRARLSELQTISTEIRQTRATVAGYAASIWRDLKQAEADETLIPAPTNVSKRRWLFGILVLSTFFICISLNSNSSPPPSAHSQPSAAVINTPSVHSTALPQAAPLAPLPNLSGAPAVPSPPVAILPPVASTNWPPTADTKSESSKPSSAPSMPLSLNAEEQQLSAPASSGAAPPPETNQPVERSDSSFVNSKLSELGYLEAHGSGDAVQVGRAIRDIKVVNGLPNSDEVDPATIRLLNSRSPLPAKQSFLGGWSADESCTDGVELEISATEAKTDSGSCKLNRVSLANNMWKVQARCQVGTGVWAANITFKIIGRRLQWSSEKGRQDYYRCR